MEESPGPIETRLTSLHRRLFTYAVGGALVMALVIATANSTTTPVVFLVGIAVVMLALYVRLGAVCVVANSDGVLVERLLGSTQLRWAEVEGYTFLCYRPRRTVPAHGSVLVAVVAAAARALERSPVNRTFAAGRLVVHGGGRRVAISHRYYDMDRVLDRMFAELHARLADRPVSGALAFDGAALRRGDQDALPAAQIQRVVVYQTGHIAVHVADQRRPWASMRMDRVANVMLLIEQLALSGVKLELSNALFLPESTLRLLRSAPSAHAPAVSFHLPGG